MYKNLIFDLDGTLLQTMTDIAHAVNEALSRCGYPFSYSVEEVQRIVGNGANMLMKRALKEKGEDPEAFAAFKATMMPLYAEYQTEHTEPYEGITNALMFLQKEGRKFFVVTNKPHHLAQAVMAKCFPKGLFTLILGAQDGISVKPDPFQVNRLISVYGLKKEETLYVGDSGVDVETGKNAEIDTALCLWGYGNYTPELKEQATYLLSHPGELIKVAFGLMAM